VGCHFAPFDRRSVDRFFYRNHKNAFKDLMCCLRGSSSVGRALPCQGSCRGFDPRLPLFKKTTNDTAIYLFCPCGKEII
jgi:hypothetical protein